jgi:3-oxoacyl-[acyl-carrier protein] reductase
VSIALITGATRGIGHATALRLAADGHDIAVGYGHDAETAGAVAGELQAVGVRAITAGGDLRDPATAGSLVTRTEAELGPVDILIANAGVATPPRRIEEIDLDEWNRLQEVNLRAPFLLAQRVLPGMTERGFGRIVLVSSVAAYTGGIIGAHYAASKAGLHGLGHSIAKQAAADGVTANVIAPALVESDMLPDDPATRDQLAANLPVGRLGRPEEVADLIAAVVANAYITNQSILVDGGWHPS